MTARAVFVGQSRQVRIPDVFEGHRDANGFGLVEIMTGTQLGAGEEQGQCLQEGRLS